MATNERVLQQLTETKGEGVPSTGSVPYKFIAWPPELGTKTDVLGIRYPHVCAFFINENVKDRSAETDRNMSRGATTARIAGTYKTADAAQLNVVTNRISNGGFSTTTRELVGALSSSGAQATVNQIGEYLGFGPTDISALVAKTYKRLNLAIFLPMPQKVSHSYGVQYNEQGMEGMWGTALTALNNEGIGAALKNGGEQFVRGTLSKLAAAAAKQAVMGDDTAGKKIFNKTLGTAENPRTEQVFDKVEVREFTFEWVFFPKSEQESNDLRDIMSLFKENMLPAFRSDDNVGGIYTMPNEFDIEFYTSQLESNEFETIETFKENRHISRISTCVLTGLQINSTPDGKFTAFKGTGAPISLAVSMTFKELSPLHRGMVGDGNEFSQTRTGGH
jgi:hypothetical protein